MFRRILVAIDGSDYTARVIPTALEIAQKFGSQVFVLHVAEHDRGRSAVHSTESVAEAMKLVGDAVRQLKAVGIDAGGQVHEVVAGRIAKDIVETADDLGSDLIVMGSRGLSDVQGILLGSVTHQVMHLARVAVLVARGPIPVKAEARQPLMAAAPALAY
jgi:nucleotide-binding universal stress UspA family protein